jgi:dihydrofolate reductase
MTKVSGFTLSIDGYGAGPNQDLEHPMGIGATGRLHKWLFETQTFQEMIGKGGGSTGTDNDFAARSMENTGAWIMGRNMFGPVRGEWPDYEWKGWWGPNPPYHCDVFVLTHHARPPLEMEGNNTFYFVTDGIHAALERAKAAAGEKDIRIGGGVEAIRQYLKAGLIDEMHLAISPILVGSGEHLLFGIDLVSLGYKCTEHTPTQQAMHVILTKP